MMNNLGIVFRLQSIAFVVFAMTSCDPPPSKTTEHASGEVAGAEVAGAEVAGAEVAGAEVAGAEVAGAEVAGAEVAGEDVAGAEVAGEDVAGEDVAGAEVAGEMLAGEVVAGEMHAGLEVAGEMMAGERPIVLSCDYYCDAFIERCEIIANSKWGEDEQERVAGCLSRCSEIPREGEVGDEFGESVACLTYYADEPSLSDDLACFGADPDGARPCFDFLGDLTDGAVVQGRLELGSSHHYELTISTPRLVRIVATDGIDCFENDFNFKVLEISSPLEPALIAESDDFNIDELDFCPFWIGTLEVGHYEIEVGSYQNLGTPDLYTLEYALIEELPEDEECEDQFSRPIAPCEDQGRCEAGVCITLLAQGELCSYSSETVSRCQDHLFCYRASVDHVDGECEAIPTMLNDFCSQELAHCPEEYSCIEAEGQFRCLAARCGDGMINLSEDCDDGGVTAGDGCSDLCLFETRAFIAVPTQSVSLFGHLSEENPTWDRLNESCNVPLGGEQRVPYSTRVLVNNTGSIQSLTLIATWSNGDGFLHLYRGDIEAGELDLNSPIERCEVGSDDGPEGITQSVLYEVEISPNEAITLVFSSFAEDDFIGSFELHARTHGCGDGFLQSGEECDDGNTIGADGCSEFCQREPSCGDGILDEGEECDDGNTLGADGCSALCESEPIEGIPFLIAPEGEVTIADGGVFGGSATWQRPGTFGDPCLALDDEEEYAFEYIILVNETGFDQTVDIDLMPIGEFDDFYIHIYEYPFNPQNGTRGCLGGVDGGGVRFNDDRLTDLFIPNQGQFALIISSYDPVTFGYPGSFQLEIRTQVAERVDACTLLNPRSITRVEGEEIDGQVVVLSTGRTDLSTGADIPLVVEFGIGPEGSDPLQDQALDAAERAWRWFSASQNSTWIEEAPWLGYDEYLIQLESPAVGRWSVATRASLGGQGWVYCDLSPEDGFQAEDLGELTILPYAPPQLLINEIDYDQDGQDLAEFIELFNPGPAQVDLAGWTLELIDGSSGALYMSIDLTAINHRLNAGEYLVVGSANLIPFLPMNIFTLPLAGSIQNGGATPDGVRILDQASELIDSLSYEGMGELIDGCGEGEGVVNGDDPLIAPSGSLSRCPHGSDTNQNRVDFQLSSQATPGEINFCP